MIAAFMRALRIHPTVLPGYRLTANEVPKVFAVLQNLATKMNLSIPGVVFLDDKFNASVVDSPRWCVFGREVELRVGMPLLQALTPSEFESVLAHELGHVGSRDGWFSGWVFRMVRRYENLFEQLRGQAQPFARFLNWCLPRFEAQMAVSWTTQCSYFQCHKNTKKRSEAVITAVHDAMPHDSNRPVATVLVLVSARHE
jgi:Zn-dependent protease with chaperone function